MNIKGPFTGAVLGLSTLLSPSNLDARSRDMAAASEVAQVAENHLNTAEPGVQVQFTGLNA